MNTHATLILRPSSALSALNSVFVSISAILIKFQISIQILKSSLHETFSGSPFGSFVLYYHQL